MKITEVISTELSGYCNLETGECVTNEPETPTSRTNEKPPDRDDHITPTLDESENRHDPIRR